jgi:hypothetical protein
MVSLMKLAELQTLSMQEAAVKNGDISFKIK